MFIIEGHRPFRESSNSSSDDKMLRRLVYYLVNKSRLEKSNLSVLGRKEKISYILTRTKRAIEKLKVETEIRIDPLLTKLNLRNSYPLPYLVEVLQKVNIKALIDYVPRPYTGRVVIFRASEQLLGASSDPYLGWGRFIDRTSEVFEIPARHENIVDEPWVGALAEKVIHSLDFENNTSFKVNGPPETTSPLSAMN